MIPEKESLKIGLFVFVSLVVLALLVFFIGKEQHLFKKQNHYKIYCFNAQGLVKGNPVKLNGVTVGKVKAIRLSTKPEQQKITITISVDKRYEALIRGDSRCRIRTLGLLGDKFVDISSGSPEYPVLPDGASIPVIQPTDIAQLLSRGEDAMDNILAISVNLRQILEKINRGETPLHDILWIARKDLEKLDRLLGAVENKKGILGTVILDEAYKKETLKRIDTTLGNMERFSHALENKNSLAYTLTRDAEYAQKLRETTDELAETIQALKVFIDTLEVHRDALLPRLLADQALSKDLLEDFEGVLTHTRSILQKLDYGKGTAGALINDPSLYLGVEDLLYGMESSRFLRWLIRKKRAKGEKERLKN